MLVGPVHGDLHCGNVCVRATDAIVIDFLAHRSEPLLYDAACLEASLLVEGFAGDERSAEEWLSSIKALYERSPLDGTLPHPNPKNKSSWFYTSVHQIRRYARGWECGPKQYAGALAVAFLIKSTKARKAAGFEAARYAAAYVLAEQVLSVTFPEGI